MKLLFVHERFGAWAGAEANVLWTATELKRRGHAVGLIHGPGTGRSEDAWRETFGNRYPLPSQQAASAIRTLLEEFTPDLVYVHKVSDLEVLEALVSANLPLVRMVHDHDLYCLRSYKYHYFSRRICTRPASLYCVFPCGAFLKRNHDGGFPVRWANYRAKRHELRLHRRFWRMVVASDYVKAELLRNGFDPRRIEVHAPVPRGVGSDSRSSFSARNLILFAGQIIRGKGVDVLLEALAKVREPFECIILGDGNHRQFCERLSARLRLEDRVRFAGFIPQEALQAHYREASLMVLSSVWPEPFGAVGLEGMRHALPVVAFDAGGIREWLIDGFNGYLVPWMDRARLAARVQELLRDKPLARLMGERAHRWVSERYDFSNYILGLENLFERAREKAA
ncbi:MAG: glycosyltransferase family 4 protein [Limisphaerales bacterium]